MKRANSQEPKSEISHSCFPDMVVGSEQAPSGNAGRSKSAAMLGLALSFGASGVLFADSEATAAVGSFVPTQSAASSESPQLPSVLNHQQAQPAMSGQGSTVYHTVEHGDSLWQIAKEHQVNVQDIKVANRISPDAPLQVGQVIKVPGEELATTPSQPTLVSLLPGAQRDVSDAQAQAPSLERLVATIEDGDVDVPANLQQSSDISESVDEPVVAAEELTGDVSLRSAGLVSQADGFQADLEQLASNTQISEVQQTHIPVQLNTIQSERAEAVEGLQQVDVQVDASEEAVTASEHVDALPSAAYEVRPGDTVDNIALALGTTPDELSEANDLENPDFIVTGDTLAVPEQVASKLVIAEAAESLASSSSELTASTSLSDFDGTRLSRLQSTVGVERRINAPSTLQLLQGDEAAASSQSAVEAEPVAVEDPYTADLLAEVSSAQQLNASVKSDDEAIALRQATPAAENTVVNPEFQGSRLEARGGTVPDVETGRPELLAAAPLDPSIYVSSPTPAAGQVVSPEMPILPSADEYLPEAPDYFNGYIWPTRGTLTSGYGWRWGRMHRGIDVAGPVGTPIVSAAPGVIEKAGWNSGGYGNLVEVRHADGSMTRYAHNSRIVVRAGQRVAQGEHIADMGSTGYSTGPHLHFEVHLPERGTVNPMAMLPSR